MAASDRSIGRTVETLVFVVRIRSQGNEVLLALREVGRNKDLWVPLGGPLAFDESPRQSAIRSLQAVGLLPTELIFRGMITDISPVEHMQWVIFVYVATKFEGDSVEYSAKGKLQWWPITALPELPLPQSEAVFSPHVLNLGGPIFEAVMRFNDSVRLVDIRAFDNPNQEA